MYLYEYRNLTTAFGMTLCYLLLIVQMGSMTALIRRNRKETMLWTIPSFLITLFLLVLMLHDDTDRMSKSQMIFLLSAVAYTIWLTFVTVKTCRTMISNDSIKESIDHLPSGIGFSEKNGLVLLANDCMERICYELTGSDFQDANAFWRQISDGAVSKNVQKLQTESVPAYQTADGTVWSLERKQLHCAGKEIFQYTATDTTLLYQMSEKIQKNNEELTRLNGRLRQYGKNLEEYVKNRELLELKMKIHDKMGQALLATRIWLLQNTTDREKYSSNEKSLQEILRQWELVIALMKKENEPVQDENTWRYVTEAADFAGVKLSLEGKLPKNPDTMHLFVEAAAEALTNAVRHGNADTFFIRIQYTDRKMHCRFTNNGNIPTQPVTESGGLASLRTRIEKAGGRMQVKTEPCFSLEFDLPEGEINESSKCSDCGR